MTTMAESIDKATESVEGDETLDRPDDMSTNPHADLIPLDDHELLIMAVTRLNEIIEFINQLSAFAQGMQSNGIRGKIASALLGGM